MFFFGNFYNGGGWSFSIQKMMLQFFQCIFGDYDSPNVGFFQKNIFSGGRKLPFVSCMYVDYWKWQCMCWSKFVRPVSLYVRICINFRKLPFVSCMYVDYWKWQCMCWSKFVRPVSLYVRIRINFRKLPFVSCMYVDYWKWQCMHWLLDSRVKPTRPPREREVAFFWKRWKSSCSSEVEANYHHFWLSQNTQSYVRPIFFSRRSWNFWKWRNAVAALPIFLSLREKVFCALMAFSGISFVFINSSFVSIHPFSEYSQKKSFLIDCF